MCAGKTICFYMWTGKIVADMLCYLDNKLLSVVVDFDSVKQGRQAVLRKFNVKHCADYLNNSADILFVF